MKLYGRRLLTDPHSISPGNQLISPVHRGWGESPTQTSVTLAQRDGAVTVNPIANGPLEVTGNLEICSGTGRTLNRTQKAFLCRCGASNNKPFCDGSHKKTGFTAPGVAKGRQ